MTLTNVFETAPDFIDVGHSQIAHWAIGQGPDLLFVHGWPLHSATYKGLVDRLKSDFRCHLIDLPGCGLTKWDEHSRVSVADHTETLKKVVDALGLSAYSIIAHDSGALFSRLLAAEDDRVKGLVMGNTEIPGHRPKLVELIVKANKIPGLMRAVSTLLRSRTIRRTKYGYAGCFHDLGMLDGDFNRHFIQPMFDEKRVFKGQTLLLNGFDFKEIDVLEETHAKIKAPVCMIWGAQDPFFPLRKARRMVDQFKGGAELHVVDPGKLFIHEEFPETFANHARTFLKRCAIAVAA